MNFAQTSAGSEGIDDSIDAKPQLLGFNNLAASVWSSQQKQPQQSISQDLLASSASSVIDVPFLPSAHNASNTSPQSSSSNGGNNANSNDGGDAEGVWSPDIDQAFHEALQIYPPCGRRKIILSDEGKMYGRNELIARYIKIRCGKTRTRKQVSSHIQVLARKKQREQQSRIKTNQDGTTDFPMESLQEPMAGTAPPSATSSSSPNPQLGGPDSVESTPSFNNNNISDISPQTSANLMNKSPNNREPIPAAASMHQKMIETASAISTSAISSMANPSPLNWPSYPLNRQNLLGNFNGQINGVQQLADRPPPSQELYSSIFALHPTMKTEPGAAGMVVVPGDMPPFSSLPCLPSSSSAPSNFTIASSNLVLCGFTAYIEQNLDGKGMVVDGENSRVEIVKIPTVSDTPLEEIRLSCVHSKYPQLLQDLFEKGPSNAFFLVKCWANMRFNSDDQRNSLFAVDSFYEASAKFDINVSTKVCSFGNEVVEKVEIYSPIDEDLEANPSKIWHFRLEKSPMCEYMVRFISKLKELQEPSLMNSVLENFTVLQIVTDRHTLDTLMVIAFIFEIREDGDDEISTNVYRIIK